MGGQWSRRYYSSGMDRSRWDGSDMRVNGSCGNVAQRRAGRDDFDNGWVVRHIWGANSSEVRKSRLFLLLRAAPRANAGADLVGELG